MLFSLQHPIHGMRQTILHLWLRKLRLLCRGGLLHLEAGPAGLPCVIESLHDHFYEAVFLLREACVHTCVIHQGIAKMKIPARLRQSGHLHLFKAAVATAWPGINLPVEESQEAVPHPV